MLKRLIKFATLYLGLFLGYPFIGTGILWGRGILQGFWIHRQCYIVRYRRSRSLRKISLSQVITLKQLALCYS